MSCASIVHIIYTLIIGAYHGFFVLIIFNHFELNLSHRSWCSKRLITILMLKREPTLSHFIISLFTYHWTIVQTQGLSDQIILLLPLTLLPFQLIFGTFCWFASFSFKLGCSLGLFSSFLSFLLLMKNFHFLNFFFFCLLLTKYFHLTLLLLKFFVFLRFTFIRGKVFGRLWWLHALILLHLLFCLFSMGCWSLVIYYLMTFISV